jgi:hypothetical protein
MKTEIYVKKKTVENFTLTLRESDRKLATPLCVVVEKNFPLTEMIDVTLKKKEVFPKESTMIVDKDVDYEYEDLCDIESSTGS